MADGQECVCAPHLRGLARGAEQAAAGWQPDVQAGWPVRVPARQPQAVVQDHHQACTRSGCLGSIQTLLVLQVRFLSMRMLQVAVHSTPTDLLNVTSQ